MPLPHDRSPRAGGPTTEVAEAAAEVAAAIAYLETLSARLHASAAPTELAAIPADVLAALRRSCQQVTRQADRALAAVSPQRADAARAAAAQIREIEALRFDARPR